MAKVRPLSELPVAVRNMAAAAKLMPKDLVPVLAKNVSGEVQTQGKPYALRGRNGRKYPLTARVRKATEKDAAIVAAEPIGFWHIVEGGSEPHLITTLGLRSGRRGRMVRAGVLRTFSEGGAIGGKPLAIPGFGRTGGTGFRQYAMHPGHGPIGQPWRKAMSKADGIVARSLHEHASRDLKKAWLK